MNNLRLRGTKDLKQECYHGLGIIPSTSVQVLPSAISDVIFKEQYEYPSFHTCDKGSCLLYQLAGQWQG